jgi:hypothetical protein
MAKTERHSNFNGQKQNPLRSGFNSKSTASEVIIGVNLEGKIAIVTGGNTFKIQN